ncbi:MAG: hypothetical protein JWL77_5210 [Chthonomonadaceae bacterium]|nr:hypothetical protein [Chthonomonadaceae bacterium]
MKAAIEQLSNDMTIVYGSLQFMETFPLEDPLRPEISQMITAGSTALSEHLIALRRQVRKHRSQCLRTPYARVRSNYLRMPDNRFSLDRERVQSMPTRDLVLSLLNELQSDLRNPENYADCDTLDQGLRLRLRQFYQMTSPVRRRKYNV